MRRIPRALAVPVVALFAAFSLGLGWDIAPDGPLPVQPDWPKGLDVLIAKAGRAGGWGVNANTCFTFHGDAKALNAFLEGYADIPGTPHRLVLHPGRMRAGAPWDEGNLTPAEWRLSILRRGWHAGSPPEETDDASQPLYQVIIDLWLGGQVALEEIDVPLAVEVTSGGEIEKFIALHEAKQCLRINSPQPQDTAKEQP